MIKLPFAEYRQAEIRDYEGHPLINALPRINSPQDTAKLLGRFPKVDEAERALPPHIRRHAMMRILDQFLYPTKSHHQLEQTISSMIRRGYLSRNIATPDYHRNLEEISRTDFKAIARNAGNEALVSSVIGCSGTGKSTGVEAILRTYPQAIYHPEYQHAQLVWLKVECPHDGSVKNLCTDFFRAVDDALGTDYQALYVKSRSSAESMLGDIARVCALHSLGLLVIDEIQHLEKSKSGGSVKILNFFVKLTNVIKVPVLFIGTPKALELFQPTMRSARRAAQFGSLDWTRFARAENEGADGQWERFFKRMWKLQWLEPATPLSQETMDLFWEYTQGIAHIAVVLFYLSQARALVSDRGIIDPTIVSKVYREELAIVHPMIAALRTGREEIILQYADLDVPRESLLAQVALQEMPQISSDEENLEEADTSKRDQLVALLVQMGIGEDIAPIVAEQALAECPEENLFGLVAHVQNLGTNTETESKATKAKANSRTRDKVKPNYLQDDLRLAIFDDPEESYQSIRRRGVIIELADYL